MKNCELCNFTHAELSYFTHEELALIPADLLRKVLDDDRPVPPSVIKRIEELCRNLPENAPKPKKIESFKEALEIVIKIESYIKLTSELSEKFSPYVQALMEKIAEFF